MSLAKYFTVSKNIIQVSIFYRARLIANFLISFISMAVVLYLWNDIYSGNASMMGYSKESIVTYYLISIFFMASIHPDLSVNDEIREGKISIYLTKPISYIWHTYFESMGVRIFRVFLGLPILVLMFVFLHDKLVIITDFKAYLFLGVSVFLAMNILFLIELIIGFLEFWIFYSDSLYFVFDVTMSFFSGAVLPLFLFPSYLQFIADILPFKYTGYFIVNTFLGRLNSYDIFFGLGIQLIWIFVLAIVAFLIWKAGLKKYEAVGG